MTVEEVIARELRLPVEKLNDESGPATIAKWDSLAQFRLVTAVEKAFKVRFSTGEITSIKSIADFKSLLRTKSAAQ